ncbi:MAG TPA: type II toxin-antitoxin system RelE/ParE family toxin [Terracidiphilus sp.]|jgi:toxin HigB-1
MPGSLAEVQAQHANRLRIQLALPDNARRPGDMNAPGWKLHALHANRKGHWAVMVSRNWRLTIRFEGEDAILVDYQDYH